jgi:hypothetical protein
VDKAVNTIPDQLKTAPGGAEKEKEKEVSVSKAGITKPEESEKSEEEEEEDEEIPTKKSKIEGEAKHLRNLQKNFNKISQNKLPFR